VSITNLLRAETLDEEQLPIRHVGYSPASTRGRLLRQGDKGLTRIHQFDKVEMVKFVHTDRSYDELESLLATAEEVLQRLGWPIGCLVLASGDLSSPPQVLRHRGLGARCAALARGSSCRQLRGLPGSPRRHPLKPKGRGKVQFPHPLTDPVSPCRAPSSRWSRPIRRSGETVLVPEALRPYLDGVAELS